MASETIQERRAREAIEVLAGIRKSNGGKALTEATLAAVNAQIASAHKDLAAAERRIAAANAELASLRAALSSIQTIDPNSFAAAKHRHQITDVDDLESTLSGLASSLENVVSVGSNANGSWARLSGELQFCWHRVSVSSAISNAFMGGFRSNGQVWTFPKPFSAVPEMSGYALQNTAFGVVSYTTPTTTEGHWSATAVTSQTAANRNISLFAIGTWA